MTFESIPTRVTYLEMREAPQRTPPPLPSSARVEHWKTPNVGEYRKLYLSVGETYRWTERILMAEEELAAILRDPEVEVWRLRMGDTIAGYAELDRRDPPDIQLAYFGLVPEYIGQGLGTFLLSWAIHRAWSYNPQRLWVHTCTLDHPRALPTYEHAGFVKYDEREEHVTAH